MDSRITMIRTVIDYLQIATDGEGADCRIWKYAV